MNSKQRKTLQSLFDNLVRKNIKWLDVEKLIIAMSGEIRQGDGSRIRIVLGEYSLNIHIPHPDKELKPYQVHTIRKLLVDNGVTL